MTRLLFVLLCTFASTIANSQTLDFTFETKNNLFCAFSKVIFKQVSTGNPTGFIWNFGNNKYSDKPVDSTVYLSAGTYTVKLVAIFGNNTMQVTKTIVINPIVRANITADKTALCKDDVVNFTSNNTAPGASYEWQFGDGSAVVNTSTPTISHAFSGFATRTVRLKTISSSGCTDTARTDIAIKAFPVTATSSQIRGCLPASINFNGSATAPPNSKISTYAWNFGDGSPVFTSPDSTASHTYTTLGDFNPTLTVITTEGCQSTYSFFNTFSFGTPPPDISMSAQANNICGSDSAVFIAKSTKANRYFWTFGDGTEASTRDTIIKHKFTSVGPKRVRVMANYNECTLPSIVMNFNVIGVIAKFDYSNSCLSKNTYSFTDSSSGKPTSILWNFGDGNVQAGIKNPVNSYPVSGEFKTVLSLHDAVTGCSDTSSRIIYTAIPSLFTADSTVCKSDSVSFAIQNNYNDTASRYTWHLLDSVSESLPNNSIKVKPKSLGNFNNFVVISRGSETCPDTVALTKPILVKGPDLDFTAPTNLCLNLPLVVTNNTKPHAPGDTIRSWSWNFDSSAFNDRSIQPAPFNYKREGDYRVLLTAVDEAGCIDTLSKAIEVNPSPFIHVLAGRDSVCNGSPATLEAVHNNDVVWSPATNISCLNCDTVRVLPPISTTYYATATNGFNCSAIDSSFVKVNVPFTATITPAKISVCPGEPIGAELSPKGKKVLWSPATGLSDPTSYSPAIIAMQGTTYTVTLSDSTGCPNSSEAILNVHVKNLPLVDAGPDRFYSTGTSFTLAPVYGNNIAAYLWSPADSLSCATCPSPSGTASKTSQYIIRVTSDSGCVASDTVMIGVDCRSAVIYMPKAFTPNNDNLNDWFYPKTVGIKTINRFTIYNRYGQPVYEARNFPPNDKLFGWDGKYRGVDQPMNTYIFTIESVCDIGEKVVKNGSFVLMR